MSANDGPLSAPTPGQVLQEIYEESSETSGAFNELSSQTDAPTILSTLMEQQNSDTIRHGNHRPPRSLPSGNSNSSSDSSGLRGMAAYNSLGDIFQPPATGAQPGTNNEENQVTGVIDFRAALLAEQRQQETILRERQRRFDEQHNLQATRRPATPTSSSAASSPTLSSVIPVPILKSPQQPVNDGSSALPPLRPNPVTGANRRRSSAHSALSKKSGAGAHNRTVSWSLDKLETEDHGSPVSWSLDKLEAEEHGSSRPTLPPQNAGNRQRLLTEETDHPSQRIELKDVVGMAPFESEAETNILRAVDEFGLHDQVIITHKPTESSYSFFSNLPEDFTLPPDEDANQAYGRKTRGHHKSISELSLGSHDHALPRPRVPIPPPAPANRSLNRNSGKSQNPPRHRRIRTRTRPTKQAHRRTMSVEEKLFGLTAQLGKLDANALEHLLDDDEDDMDLLMDNWDPQQQQHDEKESKAKLHRRVKSSAEKLVEKAQVVVTNAMPHHDDASHHSTAPSAASHSRPLSPMTDIEAAEEYSYERINGEGTQGQSGLSDHENNNDDMPSHVSGESRSSTKSHNSSTIDNEGDGAVSEEQAENPTGKTRRSSLGMIWGNNKKKQHLSSNRYDPEHVAAEMREDWENFHEFLSPRKKSIWDYCKSMLLFVVLPATAIAAILFYFIENPRVEGTTEHPIESPPSISWVILFGVRQVMTLSLALATQAFIIDYLVLSSRFSLRFLGPVCTLFLVGSKGWPFTLTVWALYDLGLLAGKSQFVKHWCYWQDLIAMCNANNPSGNVTHNDMYLKILYLAIAVGIIVALKRLIIGVILSRQTFIHYGEQLAKVMRKMVLVGEIATLSRLPLPRFTQSDVNWKERHFSAFSDDETSQSTPAVHAANNVLELPDLRKFGKEAAPEGGEPADNKSQQPETEPASFGIRSEYTESEQQLIIDLLERWEDPDRVNQEMDKKVTLSAVLQFRRALTLLKRRYPFSPAFGPSDNREMCIESAQIVYDRLLLRDKNPGEHLSFDVLAALAAMTDDIDEDKLKELIKLFRPDRDGRLSRLAFVKSIDLAYKKMRFLQANIHNSSQLDVAVEKLVNVGFYFLLACLILGVLGLDPFQLFFSLSSFVLAFSFMFGSASGKYFEGVLLILVQRPFGVGDRIHVSNSESESSVDGSSGWIVERVNLFSTTVCYGTTNERATVSNGTLAGSRIINAARSPNAVVYVNLKFGINCPYEKVQIFQSAVEAHVKARPREWLAFLGFRAFGISVDRGFIEYKIVVQHRDSWQNIVSILNSKARLTTYSLEVAKQLQMRYISPPLPVDLNVYNTKGQPLPPELQSNPSDDVTKTE